MQLAAARSSGRISVFCNLDWREARLPGYGKRMAASLPMAKQMGAIGLKVPKGLGLGYLGPDRKLIAVDDPELAPVWERAGELHLPVAIHIGDPKAFWLAPNDSNERIDELRAHPEWSNYGQPVPSWEELYAGFARLVERHPRTTFIGVHFGNAPEEPARVAKLLDRSPNLVIDTAARIPEIGRQPADAMRAFFEKYQDRVLFGTDLGIGPDGDDLMLGSTGTLPPTDDDVRRFFVATWRYFESNDRQFEHPTPIQGRWKIDGVGLPRAVLEKIYWRNAARVLQLTVPWQRTAVSAVDAAPAR
jgi:predicted TIM-barrel fold metal-dependent hydrolase